MNYSFLPFHEVAAEYISQAERYFNGITDKTEDYELNVDWDYYLQISLMGKCFIALLRDDEGVIQGHAGFVVSHHPRHKHILMAHGEAVFVEPEHRISDAEFLIKAAENSLHSLGVDQIHYEWSDFRQGMFLKKIGYQPTHTTWIKKLGEYDGK